MMKSNQLSIDIQTHLPPISPPCRSPLTGNLPSPGYTKLSEMLRKSTNSHFQCSMFCGGRKCKYESATFWPEEDRAIVVLYSHWITDDILAMSRPNEEIIVQHKLIDQFKKHGIKTIINLQEPGEHSSCGPTLDQCGFTYDPKVFMDNEIFFYNFHWKDFSGMTETVLLDMVKVVVFALSQGKVAIHCHAGLGRTGVLVAAYLIFTYRCQAYNAIKFVRMRRPNSIQTREQILSLFKFANYISPCFIVYKAVSSRQKPTSFNDYLHRQRILLHGAELRNLRYIPKILFIIGEKLLIMAQKQSVMAMKDITGEDFTFTLQYLSNRNNKLSNDNHTDDVVVDGNECGEQTNSIIVRVPSKTSLDSIDMLHDENDLQYYIELSDAFVNSHKDDKFEFENDSLIDSLIDSTKSDDEPPNFDPKILSHPRPSFEILQKSLFECAEKTTPPEVVIEGLTIEYDDDESFNNHIYYYKKSINNTPIGWERLCEENDLKTLTFLLWSWFEELDSAILDNATITSIVGNNEDYCDSFYKLDVERQHTVEYLVRFVMRLCEQEQEEADKRRLVARLLGALTLRSVILNDGSTFPKEKSNWKPLSNIERDALFNWFYTLMEQISLFG